MMRHAFGVIALSAALIGGFAWLGAYFHELSGAASYDVTSWRGAAQQTAQVSPEAGRDLWNGRGACMACHSIGIEGVGIRGPNLGVLPPDFMEPIAVRAATIQEGKTAVEHMVQALYDPDAFVGPGFEAGIMTPVNGPPTVLSDREIRSLLLYLFQRSGLPVTPELEEEIIVAQRAYSSEMAAEAAEAEASRETEEPPAEGDAVAGRAHFERLGCGACHAEGESGEEPGEERGEALPTLAGETAGVELLVRIARHAVEPETPDEAPRRYAALLTVQESWDLAAFLVEAAEAEDGSEEPVAPAAEEPAGEPVAPAAEEPAGEPVAPATEEPAAPGAGDTADEPVAPDAPEEPTP